MQTAIDFTTSSPINVEKFSGQNKKIFEYLSLGHSLTLKSAFDLFGIMSFHSRISDLRNKHGVLIYDRMVVVKDGSGNTVHCKEYSIVEFNSLKK